MKSARNIASRGLSDAIPREKRPHHPMEISPRLGRCLQERQRLEVVKKTEFDQQKNWGFVDVIYIYICRFITNWRFMIGKKTYQHICLNWKVTYYLEWFLWFVWWDNVVQPLAGGGGGLPVATKALPKCMLCPLNMTTSGCFWGPPFQEPAI